MAAFHQITVRKAGTTDDRHCLKLTFTSRSKAFDFEWAAKRKGYEVETSYGYKLYNDVDEAMKDAAFWIDRN